MRLTDLNGRRVAVWGTGREGVAAVQAIAPYRPASLVAVDDRRNFLASDWSPQLAALAPLRTGEDAFEELRTADIVVRSPGVANTHPWLVALRRADVRITGGTALWMADHKADTIGVTGSKGKSTTSSLISHLLTGIGEPNALGGNIGVPVLDLPPAPRYVLELSAYQCADLDDSPAVAAVTSLFPEHLDWFGGERQYFRGKLNLVGHDPGWVVVPPELAHRPELRDLPVFVTGRPDTVHVSEDAFYIGAEPLIPRSAMPLLGRHNEANVCVALGVLHCLGVDLIARSGDLTSALATFQALPHRLSPIPDASGLTFVDDSLSTIPQSAALAIEAFRDRPLTVILGGEDRGVDYTPLRDYLEREKIEATLIGVPDSGPRILDVLRGLPGITSMQAEDLVAAVALSRRVTPAGGIVLMSPAAPSYGRFDNFAHRSRVFRQAIVDTA